MDPDNGTFSLTPANNIGPPIGEPDVVGDAPIYEGFEAVEALQEASREAGWDCDYRQIGRGRVHAATRCVIAGEVTILHEKADRCIQVRASTPHDSMTIFVPMPGVSLSVNGHNIADNRILILPPGTDVLGNAPPPNESIQAHIPVDQLLSRMHAITAIWNAKSILEVQLIDIGHHASLIRNALLGLLDDAGKDSRKNVGGELIAMIATAIGRSDRQMVDSSRYHWRQRWQALRRATDFLDDHLRHPIAIPDVCEIAGVSLSTLERLFRRELDMTPSQYLLSRRLDSARRYIYTSASSRTIAEIAMESGFNHFGRFSIAYRQQFGVLPSQDGPL